MTDDTRCPGCNLPIDSGTHTFGCPHLGSDSIPVMISPGWALTRDEIAAAVEGERELRAILTDLIAELRRTTKGYLSPRAYAITVEQQREMADAAEARAMLSERPGIRVAHNDQISDTPERILLDLIVELRAAHDLGCDGCGDGYPCMTGGAYLRAEARLRLREVQGE